MKNIFRGELVRLSTANPEEIAHKFLTWSRDSYFLRLMDSEPARRLSAKANQEFIERELISESSDSFYFLIRRLADDRVIGDIGLGGIRFPHGDAFVGLGIGEREFWDLGYGTEALNLILGYAFEELNLHRISLNVFEYNERAICSYKKAGFVIEGKLREYVHRNGRHWDLVYMGILRQEWERMQEIQITTNRSQESMA